jgi:hypothetical protein
MSCWKQPSQHDPKSADFGHTREVGTNKGFTEVASKEQFFVLGLASWQEC